MAEELPRRDIDRDLKRRKRRVGEAHHLAAYGVEQPLAQRNDQSGFFRDRDEVVRQDDSALRVCPSKQCFTGGDAPRGHLHNRLVVDQEFVAIERMAQLRFDAQTLHGSCMHVLIEELVTGLTVLRLGVGHGGVGVPHEILSGLVRVRIERDTNAGASEYLAPPQFERRRHLSLNPGRDPGGLRLLADAVEQDRELVPAESSHRVARSHAAAQAAADFDEQLITADGLAP